MIFACFLPLTTGCSREISKSDRDLYLTACNAVNDYASNSSVSNNLVKTSFNSTKPLTCKESNLDKSSIKKSLVVTDIQSISQEGPLSVTVTFKAPLKSSGSNALLSVRLVFKIKNYNAYKSLTEYIYCTTKYNGGDARNVCNDYDTSGKVAYTSSNVTEIIKTGAYKKVSTNHQSFDKAAADTTFSFKTGIELLNGNVNYNGEETQVYNGIAQIAINVSIDDSYESPEQTIIALAEEGLNVLYSSKNMNSNSYTYLDAAVKRLEKIGIDSSYFKTEKLAKTKITYTLDEADITANVDSGIYYTTQIVQSEGTLIYSMVSFKYQIKVFYANATFASSYSDTIILGKIENSANGSATWYILKDDKWSDDSGFSTNDATKIETGDDYRCPGEKHCSYSD